VSVRATLIETNDEGVTLEFHVADNGIGIDAATCARLFTAFIQADTSTTRSYGGTGLGLAISRRLANIMGGEITVQSEPGNGALFCVRIPFALSTDQEDLDGDPSVQVRPIPDPQLLAGLSCLVLGGPNGITDDLTTYLEHEHALVERATDPAMAVVWMAQRPVGLCVIVVVVDSADANSPLEQLRAAARAYPRLEAHFVLIGRGQRRKPRSQDADLVLVDGNVLTRKALLNAVAIAAGRAKTPDKVNLPSVRVTLTPLASEEARQQGRLILVAEDNDINQKVILQQLTLLGQTANIANNGREALVLWQTGDYGILITDLHMPGMDGYELTTAIRTAEAGKVRMPIIAFTANALKGAVEHCLASGMDDYLSKPVQLVNLQSMLEKWLPIATSDPIRIDTASTETVPRAAQTEGNAAAVNVNVLRALIGNDEAMIREFLHDFRISATKIAVDLRPACVAGKAATACALAHKLKSSARSVGALALGELCAELEEAGKCDDAEALATLLPRFEQGMAKVEIYLATY
jgi:CheY-like chemotaxis protein/HPt (histidine-containing phosphotransfer) domain-containing protein